jgi:hypothetical protein
MSEVSLKRDLGLWTAVALVVGLSSAAVFSSCLIR